MLTIPNYNFSNILTNADALLIVPPFAELKWPSLALHILQACAKKAGFSVKVFYANLAMAAWIQEDNYQYICEKRFLGETIFSRNAYSEKFIDIFSRIEPGSFKDCLIEIENHIDAWIKCLIDEILKHQYKVIGCTTSFEQTNSSIALINQVKRSHPEIITILGGANCQEVLAEGILSLSNNIDYVFSGESEIVFPEFLKDILNGTTPKNRIIHEQLCDLDDIPVPDYSDYICQLDYFSSNWKFKKRKYYLSYETSRGCWWGRKNRCNFCGTFGVTKYREKSPEKVIQDLSYLIKSFGIKQIFMTDCIMPYNYYKTLLPKVASLFQDIQIFYELKSNTTFEQLVLLKKAGVKRVQPGIESLSSSLLKRMNKGVFARQNISLLRNAKSLGISCYWNFLYSFPDDTEDDYKEICSLLPLMVHLEPPLHYSALVLTRFSPYFNYPNKFGIKNITPQSKYKCCFPSNSIEKVASEFDGEYESFSKQNQSLMSEIRQKIEKWQELWKSKQLPKLELVVNSKGKYLLIDTRGLGEPLVQTITPKQAMVILFDRPVDSSQKGLDEEINWGLNHKLLITIDSWYISLVTAAPELINEIKSLPFLVDYAI